MLTRVLLKPRAMRPMMTQFSMRTLSTNTGIKDYTRLDAVESS